MAQRDVFIAPLVAFFIAEIGEQDPGGDNSARRGLFEPSRHRHQDDRRDAGREPPCCSVGNRFARKLPMRAIHIGASVLFVTLGLLFVLRALVAG